MKEDCNVELARQTSHETITIYLSHLCMAQKHPQNHILHTNRPQTEQMPYIL